jgi:hypothetical protein
MSGRDIAELLEADADAWPDLTFSESGDLQSGTPSPSAPQAPSDPKQVQSTQTPAVEPAPDPKAPALSSQGATANTSTTSPVQMTSLTTGHSASIIAAVLAGRSADPES